MSKHYGSCHCGKVKFEVEMEVKNAISCNCSICLKRGSLLDFVPETQFKILSGENELKDYVFNKRVIHHLFCQTCGILPFGRGATPDGTKMVAINLRCLDGIDLKSLSVQEIDGKNF